MNWLRVRENGNKNSGMEERKQEELRPENEFQKKDG